MTDTLDLLRERGLWRSGEPLRLHLGCGEQLLSGYINIDFPPDQHNVMDVRPDLEADILGLQFPPESVSEIRLHHVFEHFSRVTALSLLIRWHDWLTVGGVLHIETPDIVGSARTIVSEAPFEEQMAAVRHLAGDQAAAWGYHVDHWFAARFERTLTTLGFSDVDITTSQWPQSPYLANVEVRAIKAHPVALGRQLETADELLWDSVVAPEERPTWEVWRRQLREAVRQTPSAQPAGITAEHRRPIAGVVFSKDRPLQLQATLDSFFRHCVDPETASLCVLYVASSAFAASLYQLVQAKHPTVLFVEEDNFKADLLNALGDGEYWLFVVDDTLFVRPFRLAEQISTLDSDPRAIGFSIRLGRNAVYCYPARRLTRLPDFSSVSPGILVYDWTTEQDDFGYPLDLSSSLYRARDLRPLLRERDYTNPNTLEAGLEHAAAELAAAFPRLLCYARSAAFAVPLNIVQNVFPNRASTRPEHSVGALLDRFQAGYRIDVAAYDGFVPNACHQEVPLRLLRETGGVRSLIGAVASLLRKRSRLQRSLSDSP